jgi:electron transfer flavoprotein beta subunit
VKILVPVKRVSDPDNANKVRVTSDGGAITTEGLEWKPNPFDDWAVEAALRLTENGETKERLGETVIVSIGPGEATQQIRHCLAMGADRGILVKAEDASLDSTVVAAILKALVDKEKPDLVVTGKQTADGESGAVPSMLAEKLGWPVSTFTSRITTSDGGKTLTVARELDVGLLTMKVKGPAVVSVSDRILAPQSVKNGATPDGFSYPELETSGRYASLKGIMAAKKKPIEEISVASLGIAGTATSTYAGFAVPPPRSGAATFVENAAQLVEKLRTEAKVL